jgi:hypothetical protein
VQIEDFEEDEEDNEDFSIKVAKLSGEYSDAEM